MSVEESQKRFAGSQMGFAVENVVKATRIDIEFPVDAADFPTVNEIVDEGFKRFVRGQRPDRHSQTLSF